MSLPGRRPAAAPRPSLPCSDHAPRPTRFTLVHPCREGGSLPAGCQKWRLWPAAGVDVPVLVLGTPAESGGAGAVAVRVGAEALARGDRSPLGLGHEAV
ncbi:hypothetical protein SipoB123_14100 [Streptomyces ipomoeae]|nr:hypothetical protein SipoB123_14100 [Streptomyces ipomoeae]